MTRTLDTVAALEAILGAGALDTDPDALRAASVDRFKKYPAAHGIYRGPFPAVIAYPRSTDEVAAVLTWADEHRVPVVPRTGGTSTEGGLEVVREGTIVLDGSRMDAILAVDPVNMMATVQCGVPLQRLEDELRAQGLTTGHSPQSKPVAQYGGLTATRSIGQFSTLYGGIEDMVVGLEAVFPGGLVSRIKNVPRRAAGPDLRHIVIGNEGALCFVTEVTIKLFAYQPQHNRYLGYLLDDFGAGVQALRGLVTAGYRPSVCRLYSHEDGAQHFAEIARGKNIAILVAEGPAPIAAATADAIAEAFADHEPMDPAVVESWLANLNWGPDKIDAEKATMLADAHLGYTTEVSADWSRITELYEAVLTRIRTEFPRAADLTLLGAHSSHSYQTGTNLYFVYDYAIRCTPEAEIDEYHIPLNAIIVEEALRVGGSMVHHHGIGKYRTPWTATEHGSAYPLLERLKDAFDPNGIMNPGSVLPLDR